MLKTYLLKNGIKIASFNLPELKSVHLRISMNAGSLMETKANNGVAHFMEHILVQGIPSFPTVEDLSSYVESLAGTYSAYTQQLLVNFNITVPSSHLEDAIKIGSEIMFEPLFPPDSIEKEKVAVLSEISQRMDSHYYKIGQFFRETRFKKNHPLILDTGGSIEVVSNFKREDIISFWEKFFSPGNSFIVLVGNLKAVNLDDLIKKFFDKYPQKPVKNKLNLSNSDFSGRNIFIRKDLNLKAIYFDLTFPAMNMEDPLIDRILHNLVIVSLGRLRNSRLFKLLRYKKGLVYDVTSGWSPYPGLGYVYISSHIAPENLEEVAMLVAAELSSLAKNGLTKEEIDFAKNFLSNQWLMSFDHPDSIADWLDREVIWEKEINLPEHYIKLINGIKPDQILKLLQKYWDFGKLNLSLQGPIEDSKENRDQFEKIFSVLK